MELNFSKESNNICETLIDPEEEKLNSIFTENTEEILKELNLNIEALDHPNFSVVDYINEMFPNEQSLANIDDIMAGIDIRIKELDEENRQVLRGQWKTESEGQKAVQEATATIQDLFSKIRDVQDRATHSENMVKEITRDIQQLDLAKKNLTVSITTLNNLTLMMASIDHLKTVLNLNAPVAEKSSNPFDEMKDENGITIKYDEVDEHLVQSKKILQQLLLQYPDIPVIKDLNHDMQQIINELNQGKLQSDIRKVLMSGKANTNNPTLVEQLHAMCRVIDQLDPSIRTNLIKWFIDQQLSEYRVLFDETQTTAWLDKIDHRYSWLRSNLLNFDKRFSLFFPKSWMMTERLICEFCEYTKQALSSLMRQRITELTDNLIIFAIKRTHAFEEVLSKSFCAETLTQLVISKTKKTPKDVDSSNPFNEDFSSDNINVTPNHIDEIDDESALNGLISSCFEPHLHLYIEDVNKVLNDQLTNHLIGDTTVNESSMRDKEFEEVLGESLRNESIQENSSDDTAENSLNSATNLFLFYRKLLNQAPQLSRGQTLVELSKVLRKYLREYNNKVLLAQLPLKKTGVMSVANSLTGTGGPVLSANQIIQSLLKDEQTFRLSKEDIKKVSVILVTACYCLKTVEELEKRLKSKVKPSSFSKDIDFSGEIELFNQCRTSCVQLMASDLECSCEPALTAMYKLNWASVEVVGDQSNYVTAIVGHLRENVPLIRQYLHNVRAFFTQFCIQFVNGFISKFIAALFKCRVTTTVGAEQLLLDTHSLKTVLVKLPIIGSKIYPDPPRSFTTVVLQGMGHAEKIIKVVMTPCVRAADFVDGALHLLPDCDSVELQKILDMKGMKRPEQASIIDLFKKKQHNNVQHQKPDDMLYSTVNQEGNRMTQLEKLIKIIK